MEVKHLKGRRLVSMGKIWKDRSKMSHLHRYPKLQLRVGDELLFKIKKEVDKSGMTTSGILKKALSEYFDKRGRVEN